MTDLGTLPGSSSSQASAINDSNVIVGNAGAPDGSTHAFRYRLGSGTRTDLGTLPGDWSSYAKAINDRGAIVGYSFRPGGSYKAFSYDPATRQMTDLGTIPGGVGANASGINNSGAVSGGTTFADGHSHASLLTSAHRAGFGCYSSRDRER